jgi:RNA methyltransferase, TrmH family
MDEDRRAVVRRRSSPVVRRLRKAVHSASEQGLCLVEGVRLIEEALSSGIEIVEVVASTAAESTERGRRLIERLAAATPSFVRVEAGILESLSGVETSQGLLVFARRPRFSEEALFQETPLLLVAVEIQNPGNLGGLLRTAEAAGATGAYVVAGCADPLSAKALRGSMGSAFRLPHVTGLSLQEVLRRLASRGVRTAACLSDGGAPFDQADLSGPIALVFGSEAAGLPPEIVDRSDLRLSIPVAPRVESLNVSVAAGVLLFEAARQRRAPSARA